MATDSTSASKAQTKPSSSTSELFGGLYARGGVTEAVCDAAWLRAMLDVEVALARATGAPDVAERIAALELDVAEIGRLGAAHASPVVPLAGILRERAGAAAHDGATSQDVLDTALMLVARRALAPLLDDAAAAADGAADLAARHRDLPIIGRTLLQHALPTSFGLKAAGWMTGIDEAIAGSRAVREHTLAVQMGGPVGQRDPAVAAAVAAELGLGFG